MSLNSDSLVDKSGWDNSLIDMFSVKIVLVEERAKGREGRGMRMMWGSIESGRKESKRSRLTGEERKRERRRRKGRKEREGVQSRMRTRVISQPISSGAAQPKPLSQHQKKQFVIDVHKGDTQ